MAGRETKAELEREIEELREVCAQWKGQAIETERDRDEARANLAGVEKQITRLEQQRRDTAADRVDLLHQLVTAQGHADRTTAECQWWREVGIVMIIAVAVLTVVAACGWVRPSCPPLAVESSYPTPASGE